MVAHVEPRICREPESADRAETREWTISFRRTDGDWCERKFSSISDARLFVDWCEAHRFQVLVS